MTTYNPRENTRQWDVTPGENDNQNNKKKEVKKLKSLKWKRRKEDSGIKGRRYKKMTPGDKR